MRLEGVPKFKWFIPFPGGAGAKRTPPLEALGFFGEAWCGCRALCPSVSKDEQEQADMAARLCMSHLCLEMIIPGLLLVYKSLWITLMRLVFHVHAVDADT